jgi:hypothetical protein
MLDGRGELVLRLDAGWRVDRNLVGLLSHCWAALGIASDDLLRWICTGSVAWIVVAANDHGLENSCLHKHRTWTYPAQRKTGKKALRDCIVALKCGTVSTIDGVEASWTERLSEPVKPVAVAIPRRGNNKPGRRVDALTPLSTI